MNKFNVNTSGIEEVGFLRVNGGKIHCTVDEFINMHWLYKIRTEKNNIKQEIFSFENEKLVNGKEFNYPKDEKGRDFCPMWEGDNFVCYVDVEKSLVEQDEENNELWVEETGFIIETWEENKFYPYSSILKYYSNEGEIKSLDSWEW